MKQRKIKKSNTDNLSNALRPPYCRQEAVEKRYILSPIVVALFHSSVGLDHTIVQGTQRMEVYSVLLIEPKASYMLDKCPATELHPQVPEDAGR